MNERDVNTIVVNSMSVIGKKISDGGFASRGRFTQNPFDGFGIHEVDGVKKNVYFESKYSKGLKAFDLNRIAPHQAESLDKFGEGEGSMCLVPYGVHVKRGDLRIYLFLWAYLRNKYYDIEPISYDGETYYIPKVPGSIFKKDLEELPYEKVKKRKIEFTKYIK